MRDPAVLGGVDLDPGGDIVAVHVDASPPEPVGTKPKTTRAGNPSWRAMSAAATAYCSASPIMRGAVKSSVMRSAA